MRSQTACRGIFKNMSLRALRFTQCKLPAMTNERSGLAMTGGKGISLIAVIIIMLIVATLALLVASTISTGSRSAAIDMQAHRAFYIAEAGIEHVIFKLKDDSSYRNSPITVSANLGNGSFSAVVSKNGNTYTLTSTGTAESAVRVVVEDVVIGGSSYPGGVPQAFSYAMHSFGNNTKLKDSDLTINGNVAAANSVQNSGDPTIHGTVTSHSSVPTPFNVDMASYQSIANHVESGGFTFTEGHTYGSAGSEQIWYIQGNCTIEEDVIIYGSVIAENNITIQEKDITIDAASGYPALIAGNNIKGDGLEDSTINGLIAAGNNVDLDNLEEVTINGVILSGNDTFLRDGDEDSVINYDVDVMNNPPPFFNGYAASVTVQNWKESL